MTLEKREEDLQAKIRRLAPELRPRPNTDRLWLDLVFLIFILAIQFAILPTFLGPHLAVDLATPWLVISFVRQRAPQATVLAVVAALTLESHSSIPAGLYISAYWIMANVIIQVRPALSWRHKVPWLVTFAVAELWVILFESFVIVFTRGLGAFSGWYVLMQSVRLLTAVFFGMQLCQEWLEFDAEEPVPQ